MTGPERRDFARRLAESPASWPRLAELSERSRTSTTRKLAAAACLAFLAVAIWFTTLPSRAHLPVTIGGDQQVGVTERSRAAEGGPRFVANGESFYCEDSGVASKHVRVELALVQPPRTAANAPKPRIYFSAYHLVGRGLVGVRSDQIEVKAFSDRAELSGTLADFASTDHVGTHRVILVATAGRRPPKLWFAPGDESAIEFRIHITNPEPRNASLEPER